MVRGTVFGFVLMEVIALLELTGSLQGERFASHVLLFLGLTVFSGGVGGVAAGAVIGAVRDKS